VNPITEFFTLIWNNNIIVVWPKYPVLVKTTFFPKKSIFLRTGRFSILSSSYTLLVFWYIGLRSSQNDIEKNNNNIGRFVVYARRKKSICQHKNIVFHSYTRARNIMVFAVIGSQETAAKKLTVYIRNDEK
jgi:hypothetical protein